MTITAMTNAVAVAASLQEEILFLVTNPAFLGMLLVTCIYAGSLCILVGASFLYRSYRQWLWERDATLPLPIDLLVIHFTIVVDGTLDLLEHLWVLLTEKHVEEMDLPLAEAIDIVLGVFPDATPEDDPSSPYFHYVEEDEVMLAREDETATLLLAGTVNYNTEHIQALDTEGYRVHKIVRRV